VTIILDQRDFKFIYLSLLELICDLLFLIEFNIFMSLDFKFLTFYQLEILEFIFSLKGFEFMNHLLNNFLVSALLDHYGIYFCSVTNFKVIDHILQICFRNSNCLFSL
jgi:hypothetical protein